MKNIFKIIEEEIEKLNEVSDEMYEIISDKYNNKRIIITKNDNISFKNINSQESGPKPLGLWYGIGTSWIDWVKEEMPQWDYNNVFEILIDESKILKITDFNELMEFTNEYLDNNEILSNYYINWNEVSKKYSGIEISPYIWEGRMKFLWYYGWDVASGCIWKKDAIIGINMIN
jgi:hypothetical protein